MLPSTELFFWFFLMFLSAFFSGMEVAFISADKLRIALTKNEGGFLNYMLNLIFVHPKQFLSTLSFGNLIVLVLFVTLSLQIAGERNYTDNVVLNYVGVILVSTIAILLAGEFLPRMLMAKKPDFWVRFLLFPSFVFYILFYPLTKLLVAVAKGILTVFGIKSEDKDSNVLGRVELDSYVKKGFEDLPDEFEVEPEMKIFRNALDFSQMRLRDCMVPRADIVAINEDADVAKLRELFIETGISRILVYKEDIDEIRGYIHMWEMFNNPTDWTKNITPISFVPESMQANKMLNDLMQQHKSIAVVVDEFGGTSGIVTIEDLVEEIFGDIEDEYDSKDRFVKRESDQEFVLSGRVEIDTLNEDYSLDLPESEDYSTVAGLLLHFTQRFPKTYETIIIGKFTFKILKVTARKIEVVRLIVDDNSAV